MSGDCSVYVFAKNGRESPVKVGVSNSPNLRLQTIQTACPFKVDYVYELACPSKDIAMEIERCFHDTQTKFRLHGEWFDLDPIAAVHLLCIAYRTLLGIKTNYSKEDLETILHFAGVLHAEKRWGLCIPQ